MVGADGEIRKYLEKGGSQSRCSLGVRQVSEEHYKTRWSVSCVLCDHSAVDLFCKHIVIMFIEDRFTFFCFGFLF